MLRQVALFSACRKPPGIYLSASVIPYGYSLVVKVVDLPSFFHRIHPGRQRFVILFNFLHHDFYYFKKKLPCFKDSALRSAFITKVSSLLWLRLTSVLFPLPGHSLITSPLET